MATLRRYVISYSRSDSTFVRRVYPSFTTNSYRVTRLDFGVTYNFTVRAEVRFSFCYPSLMGMESDTVRAAPKETRKLSYFLKGGM